MAHDLFLILHDIRSTHNVGSLFRTADGFGVKKIFLTGYTPAPIDRFKRKDTRISKVSLGAEDTVLWEQGDINEITKNLKNQDTEIVALEQTENSVPLNTYTPNKDTALIVGNEVDGVSKEVLELCDAVVEIPMHGSKESFNVSNAGAIALYHFANNSLNQ